MKRIIILLTIVIISTPLLFCNERNTSDNNDYNHDGIPDVFTNGSMYDANGDGVIDYKDLPQMILHKNSLQNQPGSLNMTFTQMWSSPDGAFTNCWDGIAGYFDGDTLLDIAGYTFNPPKFYIWEQSPVKADSFYLVQEFTKAEGGSYGPITLADTDGDGKLELITGDLLGIARIYIYECTGDNQYVDRNTQTTLTHTSNGEGSQGIYVGDLNKNGKKEIILLRGTTSGGEVRIWEHNGVVGQHVYTNIYTYTTVSYIFSKGGIGDSDNDGWDEIFLTYGGLPTFNTNIRRIEFDSASGTFQHQIFAAPTIGMPASYKVYDLNNDGSNELIMTCNSNDRAACYVLKSDGPNSYVKLDSMFETTDNNNMLSCDIKRLTGNAQPTLLMGSFNGRVYTYQYDGTHFNKDYENLNYPGSAVRRVYWLPWTGYDGYFNTWSSTNSNGTFYVFKRDFPIGVIGNQTPVDFKLEQNYPNPFNPSTQIDYSIQGSGLVNISVYDINGKFLMQLVNQVQNAGAHRIDFNAADFASGIYFYKLTFKENTQIRKMVLVK